MTLNPISNVPWGSQTVTVTGKLTSADDNGGDSAISGQIITLLAQELKDNNNKPSLQTPSPMEHLQYISAPDTVASEWTVQAHYAGGDDDGSATECNPLIAKSVHLLH